jgi:LysM repeat protein
MAERRPVRYLAPLALIAVVVAAIVIVSSTTGGGEEKGGAGGRTTTAERSERGDDRAGRQKKFYRVKEGDLLSTISEKVGVDTEVLIELNPELDPQALQTGDLVRIRR